MGTIWYGCKSCEEHNPEGACYDRDMVRVAADGEWVCENCFDDAPDWTYLRRPEDEDAEQPRWDTLPAVPLYVPVADIKSGDT